MANDDYSEKAQIVRRMVQAGVELPMEKREALLRLRQRVEELWQQWEAANLQRSANAGNDQAA